MGNNICILFILVMLISPAAYAIEGRCVANCGSGSSSSGSSSSGSTSIRRSPQQTPQQTEAYNYNKYGIQAYKNGDYAKAAEYFRNSLTLYPTNSSSTRANLRKAENALGTEAYEKGDYVTAAKHFRQALALDPNNVTTQNNLRLAENHLKRDADEKLRKSKIADSNSKINRALDNMSENFNTSSASSKSSSGGSLDFMGTSEPRYTKGTKDSAPVDLGFMDSKTATVDPPNVQPPVEAMTERELEFQQAMKSNENNPLPTSSDSLHIKEVPLPAQESALPPDPDNSPKAEPPVEYNTKYMKSLETNYKDKSLQQEKLAEKIKQLEKTKKQANTSRLQAAKSGATNNVEEAIKSFEEAEYQQKLLIQAVEKIELEKREIDLQWVATQKAIRELTLEVARRYESPAPPIDHEWSPEEKEALSRYAKKHRKKLEKWRDNLPWGPGKKYRTGYDYYLNRPGRSQPKSISPGTTLEEVVFGGKG